MAPVNYAEMYAQALQQKFSQGLYFSELYETPNNQTIRWVNAKTIQIPRISVKGYVDVDRDVVGTYTRRADNDWEPKTLEHDREFKTLVDPQDIDETNMALSIANITRVFNSEEKLPEMDKYAASKLYTEFTDFGGEVITDTIDASNILQLFDEFMEEMDDAEVPQDGRILYVTPKIHTALKQADQIQRKLDVTSNTGNVSRNIRSLDEVKIKSVPSSRIKTAYDFTDGAVPDGDQINMILVHPLSVITPHKYDFVDLDAPSANTGGKWLYYERAYWDLFAIEKKIPGIKIHASTGGGEG